MTAPAPAPTPTPRIWHKDKYTISTDPSLIPLETLNAWFASEDVYWAQPLPLDALRQSLERCLCFGLFYTPTPSLQDTTTTESPAPASEFIGIARGITDYTTFVYITDVYVHTTHQGKGLGRWLVQCVGEAIDEMPYLRRSMLFTMDWERSVPFYEAILGMTVAESKRGEGMAMMMKKGRGYPKDMHE
ncbi:hypothetical protein BJY04DRAFT_79603 [Aspergillus karnatakaensis]|uniref:GNAT family N-acetyltransferase n=1 Tax=Aspergillus karnatakaensis TaxID=1810916 RepID=UPI003CCD99F8